MILAEAPARNMSCAIEYAQDENVVKLPQNPVAIPVYRAIGTRASILRFKVKRTAMIKHPNKFGAKCELSRKCLYTMGTSSVIVFVFN